MTDTITVTTQGRVTTLTINRPEKRNAITQAMYAAMADALEAYAQDDDVRAFVFTGAEEYFTSGNDISDFALTAKDGETPPVLRFIEALHSCPKPLIAAVNGPAIGIGVTMLLHCDLVIASETATFATPFVQLGVVPEAGSSILLPEAIGRALANDMLLAGRALDAQEALQSGLISRLSPQDTLAADAGALAAQVAGYAPQAMKLSKALIGAQRAALIEHMEREAREFAAQLQSSEFAEIVAAKMQKRAPNF